MNLQDNCLLVEIVAGHETPKPRTIGRGTDKERTIYEQEAYMSNGGAFPQQFKLTLERHEDAYRPGHYILDRTSFTIGKWGELSLTRNLVLKPVQVSELKKAS